MGSIKKGMTLMLIVALGLFIAKPVLAQSVSSTNTTSVNQDFYYYLPDCIVHYEISGFRTSYLIFIFPLSMDNPCQVQISFYEQLLNGTEQKVTGIIPMDIYGAHFLSTSYPKEITMIELHEPTSTPKSTTSQTPSPTPSQTLASSPSVPELSWLAIVPLLFSVFIAVIFRHRRQV
jgi:hypothetical protein